MIRAGWSLTFPLEPCRHGREKDLYELLFGPAYALVVIPLAIGGAMSVALIAMLCRIKVLGIVTTRVRT